MPMTRSLRRTLASRSRSYRSSNRYTFSTIHPWAMTPHDVLPLLLAGADQGPEQPDHQEPAVQQQAGPWRLRVLERGVRGCTCAYGAVRRPGSETTGVAMSDSFLMGMFNRWASLRFRGHFSTLRVREMCTVLPAAERLRLL